MITDTMKPLSGTEAVFTTLFGRLAEMIVGIKRSVC